MRFRFSIGFFALIFVHSVYAEYLLYQNDSGNLSFGMEAQTALFGRINNQSGAITSKNLSDSHWELSVKPHLDGALNVFENNQLYGGFSYIYSSTLGHDPSGYTQKNADMYFQENDYLTFGRYDNYRYKNKTEELFIGWKFEKLFDANEKITVDFSGGKQNYKLGSGFLLHYGVDNGGNRGAGWINPRTAFSNTVIGRLNFDSLKLEGFHLETRPLNPAEKRHYQGGNVEYVYSETATIGISYINATNNRSLHEMGSTDWWGQQERNNHTFNARLDFSPLENFTISSEYAHQINFTQLVTANSRDKQKIHALGGFAQVEYKREDLFLQPTVSYRYAVQDENFDSLSPGFSTWGTWFQGEINGEWILENSNLITHVTKLAVVPEESVTVNLIYYHFSFVSPSTFDLTSGSYGNEFNLLTDWEFSDSLSFSAGIEAFIPNKAGKQYLGGDANKTWLQGMVSASFTF